MDFLERPENCGINTHGGHNYSPNVTVKAKVEIDPRARKYYCQG
jgi:hypothetical protein